MQIGDIWFRNPTYNKTNLKDSMILEKETTDARTQLATLYPIAFPKVAKYVAGKGGTLQEAKDVFHDALVIYIEKSDSGYREFENDSSYVIGISKKLWINRYREKNKTAFLDGSYDNYLQVEKMPEGICNSKMVNFLAQSGQKCMDLLQSFYYLKIPLTQIAERFGFSGVRSATVQKYKCIEKLRETIKEKSISYEDFFE